MAVRTLTAHLAQLSVTFAIEQTSQPMRPLRRALGLVALDATEATALVSDPYEPKTTFVEAWVNGTSANRGKRIRKILRKVSISHS